MKLRGVRIFILMTLVVAVMACFTLQLMNYQITDGASYRAKADQTSYESIPIVAPRGEILDRNGKVLATNNVGYSVIIEKAGFPTAASGKQNDILLELTGILTKNGETWEDTLPITGAGPYSYKDGSDSDQKYLKSLLKVKDGQSLSADDAMKELKDRYSVPKDYTADQARTVIGVRFEMERRSFNVAKTFTLAQNVSLDTINQMSERTIPGIEISEQYSRTYPDGTAAPQVIGQVGPIYAEQYKDLKKKGYALSDIIGQSGIESSMEPYLHGVNGMENIIVNSAGTVTGREITTAPKPGGNVVLTIDSDLQHVLEQSLQSAIATVVDQSNGDPMKGADARVGAAVVVNVKTGEILGMVSYPGYDNNNYYSDYASLSKNPDKPLYNRATKGTYRPGSTFKLCTAVSGLMNGVITGSSPIACNGQFLKYQSSGYTGHDDVAPGNITVSKAIGISSNVFFDTVADRLNLKNNYLLENTAKALGLGQQTGVEIPESLGVVSGPTEAKARGNGWHYADAVQSGIGQFDNSYTPLQLADYIGAVVNGGKRYSAHLVKEVNNYDNTQTVMQNQPKLVSDLKIPDNIVGLVKQGTLDVTTDEGGTAAGVFGDYSLTVGGKTGTAQVGALENGKHNGLFIGYAPYNNPQIAVAVVVEHAAWGSQTASVARSVFDYYFLHNPDNTAQDQPAPANQLIH